MKELNTKELNQINGGLTASMLGYLIRGGALIIDAGRYFGSSLRRLISGNMCGF